MSKIIRDALLRSKQIKESATLTAKRSLMEDLNSRVKRIARINEELEEDELEEDTVGINGSIVEDEDLEQHIHKLNIADTLFKNEKIKNKILDNIAFSYLLEDQNMVNNQKFLTRYNELSTDKSKQH